MAIDVSTGNNANGVQSAKVKSIVIHTSTSLFLLSALYALYWTLKEYDWGEPYVKLLCFSIIFLLILVLQVFRRSTTVDTQAFWLESAILTLVLISVVAVYANRHGAGIFTKPVADIGFHTVDAAELLFVQHKNPYSSRDLSPLTEYAPEFRGFYYGPFMLVAYAPAVIFPDNGFKAASLFYVLLTAILAGWLVWNSGFTRNQGLAAILFVQTALFIPEKFWTEILSQGVTDIFPIMLVLASLLFLNKGKYFWAAVFTGLSISTKFAPALFLVPFLPWRSRGCRIGFLVGLIPLYPFLYWDFSGLFRNFFWMRFVMRPDSTSLYTVLPVWLHWLMPVTLLSGFVLGLIWNYFRPIAYWPATVCFTLLLIIAQLTAKEIHGNHLVWFFPLIAIIFTDGRERLANFVSRILPFHPSEIAVDA